MTNPAHAAAHKHVTVPTERLIERGPAARRPLQRISSARSGHHSTRTTTAVAGPGKCAHKEKHGMNPIHITKNESHQTSIQSAL
eukprot:749006-Amphidinium_carterae.3